MEFSIYRANVFRETFGLVYTLTNELWRGRPKILKHRPLKTGTCTNATRFVFSFIGGRISVRILTCRCLINASHNRYSGRPSSSPASKINARRRRRPVFRNERCRNRSVRERQAGNNKSPQTVLFTSLFYARQSNFLWHRRVSSD